MDPLSVSFGDPLDSDSFSRRARDFATLSAVRKSPCASLMRASRRVSWREWLSPSLASFLVSDASCSIASWRLRWSKSRVVAVKVLFSTSGIAAWLIK